MKVSKGEGSMSINLTVQEDKINRTGEKQEKKNKKANSIYAGNMNLMQSDKIAEKKIKAKREALKTIMDTFASEHELDTWQEESQKQIDELVVSRQEALNEMGKLDELKDLSMLNLGEMKEVWKERYDSAGDEINGIRASIVNVKLERLKSSPMVAATKAADEIMEAASKEIIGMLQQEAIDHIDETLENNKKKAEEQSKKKEEKESAKNDSKMETKTEMDKTESFTELEKLQNELSGEIKKLQNKLLDEDIKGLKVNKRT